MATPTASTQNKDAQKTNPALLLPPDGYSRFFVIIRLLQEIYKDSPKTINILDVGGCSPYLDECLHDSGLNYKLTIVDILPKPDNIHVDYLQEDITQSKLPDNSFDVVVSTDVLEHIPKELKDTFVKATVRLSKQLVIVAAPFDTPGVDAAEHLVNDFNKKLFGVGQDWLEEHFKYTKPSVDQTIQVLDATKLPYTHFGANNLYSWIFSAHLNLIQAKTGLDEGALRQVRVAYNKNLSESVEFSEPTYRHFFVVYKDKKLEYSNVLGKIVKPISPETYTNYIHGAMESVFEHSKDMAMSLDIAKENVSRLEQQLLNEKIHTQKVQDELNHHLNKRIKAKVAKLRHPRSATRAVIRKVRAK